MKILFCGDVVGRAGRAAIATHIPSLIEKLKLDFVVVNGENSASGFGITGKIARGFLEHGVDVITGGDHIFDQKEIYDYIKQEERLLRPANLPATLPGGGNYLCKKDGKSLLVVHLHAQLFMKLTVDSPFDAIDPILENYEMGENVDAILVDFHCEATSERMAMGHYLDSRVSLVTGSHTHVPTADCQILPGGTAYHTDAGMCGDYDSVIGFKKQASIMGFKDKIRTDKLTPALREATLCGTYVETDDTTGLAVRVEAVRVGGRLSQAMPG